jgi:hypothetical protein
MKTIRNFTGIILMAIMILTWGGCSNNPKDSAENHQSENTEKHDEHMGDEHQETNGELQLNNGKKWPADFETTKGVAELARKVADFKEHAPEPNSDDYRSLEKSLKMTLNEIFDKCTMTGPAHDELHKFLVPVLGYVKELKTDDLDASRDPVNKLDKQLALYGEYFE